MAIINFISTVWSENLLKQLDKKYIGVLHCNREYEGEIKEQGSTVKICGVGDVTVSDYTKNADITEPETLSDSVRTLKIDQAKYFNFQIDDVDRAQSNPQLIREATRVAAAALANAADSYIYNLYTDATVEVTDDAVTADSILTHIMSGVCQMLKAGVQPNDIVIEVSPDIAVLILRAKVNIGADDINIAEAGYLGKIFGCKLYVSNNVAVDEENYHKCFIRTKRAIGFAEQISNIEAYRPEKRFADGVKGLYLFGAKIVYPDELVVLNLKLAE